MVDRRGGSFGDDGVIELVVTTRSEVRRVVVVLMVGCDGQAADSAAVVGSWALATSHGEGSKAIELEMALGSSVDEHDEKKEGRINRAMKERGEQEANVLFVCWKKKGNVPKEDEKEKRRVVEGRSVLLGQAWEEKEGSLSVRSVVRRFSVKKVRKGLLVVE